MQVSQKLLRQERDEVGTHRRAKKQGQRGGKSAGSKKTYLPSCSRYSYHRVVGMLYQDVGEETPRL